MTDTDDTTAISAARLARLAVESLPDGPRVAFRAPVFARPGTNRGTIEVSWDPEMALAVAGHICRHWGQGVATARLTIEHWRTGWVSLAHEAWHGSYRLSCARVDAGPQITELCGHIGCMWDAPAGPGSRCPEHFADRQLSDYHPPTHWAEIAAEAWRHQHPTVGEEKSMMDTARRCLVTGAMAVGMEKADLHRITGIARTTIDRILAPAPDPAEAYDEDDDNAPA